MLIQVACDAIREGKVLRLNYDGFSRDLEVHAVGYTKDGVAIMRVWQISGGSVSNERTGWKLMHIGEARSAELSESESGAPRAGYKRGDKAISRIIAEL